MTPSFFSSVNRMGDFKTAFIEGMGKSLAYSIGGIIFLFMLSLLVGTGLLTLARNPKLRDSVLKVNK